VRTCTLILHEIKSSLQTEVLPKMPRVVTYWRNALSFPKSEECRTIYDTIWFMFCQNNQAAYSQHETGVKNCTTLYFQKSVLAKSNNLTKFRFINCKNNYVLLKYFIMKFTTHNQLRINRIQVFTATFNKNYTSKSYLYWTVHHCDSWRIRDQLDVTGY